MLKGTFRLHWSGDWARATVRGTVPATWRLVRWRYWPAIELPRSGRCGPRATAPHRYRGRSHSEMSQRWRTTRSVRAHWGGHRSSGNRSGRLHPRLRAPRAGQFWCTSNLLATCSSRSWVPTRTISPLHCARSAAVGGHHPSELLTALRGCGYLSCAGWSEWARDNRSVKVVSRHIGSGRSSRTRRSFRRPSRAGGRACDGAGFVASRRQ